MLDEFLQQPPPGNQVAEVVVDNTLYALVDDDDHYPEAYDTDGQNVQANNQQFVGEI